jgi:hypothetical protein
MCIALDNKVGKLCFSGTWMRVQESPYVVTYCAWMLQPGVAVGLGRSSTGRPKTEVLPLFRISGSDSHSRYCVLPIRISHWSKDKKYRMYQIGNFRLRENASVRCITVLWIEMFWSSADVSCWKPLNFYTTSNVTPVICQCSKTKPRHLRPLIDHDAFHLN